MQKYLFFKSYIYNDQRLPATAQVIGTYVDLLSLANQNTAEPLNQFEQGRTRQ